MSQRKLKPQAQQAVNFGTNSGSDFKAVIVIDAHGNATIYGDNKVAEKVIQSREVPRDERGKSPIQVTGKIDKASWAATAHLEGQEYKERFHVKAKRFGYESGVVGVMVLK